MLSTLLKTMLDEETGATAVEYGLILALIALAIVGAASSVAGETSDLWNGVDSVVLDAMGNNSQPPPAD